MALKPEKAAEMASGTKKMGVPAMAAAEGAGARFLPLLELELEESDEAGRLLLPGARLAGPAERVRGVSGG